MSSLARPHRTLARGGLYLGALVAATMLVGIPAARADQDPAQNPPNCTAADLEGVRAGVSASTSAYLFTHPDFNAYVTGLEGLSKADVHAKIKRYLDDHPDTRAEITGIRQPLVDIKDRCGAPASP